MIKEKISKRINSCKTKYIDKNINNKSDLYLNTRKYLKYKNSIKEIPIIHIIKDKLKGLNIIAQWMSKLLFPPICVFCGEAVTSDLPLEDVCRKCTAKIPLRTPEKRVLKCVEKRTEIYQTNFVKEANVNVLVACFYEEPLKKALVALKFYDAAYYKNAFGSIISFVFKNIISDYDYLIPMPLHHKRLRERGYNQACLLAEKISELTDVPLMKNCLVRKNYTKRQSEMTNKEMRIGNVSDAFYCKHPELIFNKRILIIDDVMTSGATIYCAVKELKDSVSRYCENNPENKNEFQINGLTLTSNR